MSKLRETIDKIKKEAFKAGWKAGIYRKTFKDAYKVYTEDEKIKLKCKE